MKKKNYNCRTCLITNKKYHKSELIRICKVNDKLVIDKQRNILGRGYYLSKNIKDFDPIVIKKKLEKKTGTTVDTNLLNELISLL